MERRRARRIRAPWRILNATRCRAASLALLAAGCAPGVDTTWHDSTGYRWRQLDVPGRGRPGFTQVAPSRSGVTFVNTVSDSLLRRNRILAQGGGVCAGDVNGDARPELFFARTEGASVLYRNLGGWRFEDATQASGVAREDGYRTGCAFADLTGDGHLDLLVLALGGPNTLYVNDGTGKFTGRSDAGLASRAGSTTVAISDVDGDGWLDLYVANYKAYSTLDRMSPRERSFDQVVRRTGPRQFQVKEQHRAEYKLVEREELGGISLVQRADPDVFYRNTGAGVFAREPIARNPRFLDAAGAPLAEEPEDFGLAAMFADLDGDAAPDLYVANDFEDPDLIWRNDGRGTFRLVEWNAIRSTSNSGMAVDVGDVNADGQPDLFQVDMLSQDTRRLRTQIPTHSSVPRLPGQSRTRPQMQRNTLQLNRGDGTFAEIARYAGVGASGWSWSTAFLDVDLDGWDDLLVGTGHKWDVMDGDTQHRLRSRMQEMDWRMWLFEYPPLPLPNKAFRNRRDLTFEDASEAWHFDLGADMTHGLALADLDGDGDRDVVLNRLDSPAALLRNDARAARIAVRLRGVAPNTAGIGGIVTVRGGAVPVQRREVIAGGLYLSGSDAQLTFATGDADSVDIEVRWRDGRQSVVRGARPNRLYEIDQRAARGDTVRPQLADRGGNPDASPTPLFEDATAQLNGHRHVDRYFDDFQRQLLLPNALSQLGPGVAWYDVDGNGGEDLVIGAGREGRLAVFRNDGGRLRASGSTFAPAHVDLGTVMGWPDGRGGHTILTGVSSYEMPTMRFALDVPSVVTYAPGTGHMATLVPGDSGSAGPLSAADYDGDGDLDLFVGARVLPRAYPLPASSRLFRNEGGHLQLDVANSGLLRGLGMVSASVLSDVDGNGWPDLLVALEWGPVRVFLNERGVFRAAPPLPAATSRWNGLATGDLDGDGRLDVVATSWGRNVDAPASEERPLFLYQYSTPRGPDVVLAQHDPRLGAVAPLAPFTRLGLALPATTLRLRTFAAFADAPIDQVLGVRAIGSARLAANTLDHMIFYNRGDRFEPRTLPVEAQLAPAFYAGIADFNGDGAEDLFLSQNFFATDIATPRFDAGRALLLVGDGRGTLKAMDGRRSGIAVYGDQRGAAYADYDADGRLDIAVTQNGEETRLFRNVAGAPGIRVRLVGPAGNPHGIGAVMRLRYGDRAGPVREIQSGSGYWSQNGAIQVLGRSGTPTALWIRWPGGAEQTVPLSPDQREVTVRRE